MSKTLLVLAAGMGSRYGGIKQIEAVGPSGETILDYSVYDAIRAGFSRVVFVTRREIEADFREAVGRAIEKRIDVAYVCQMMNIPAEIKGSSAARTKPWGTGHAVLSAANVIEDSFAVVNADDFYGQSSFDSVGKFLDRLAAADANEHAMVGFVLRNTLSDAGSVSRGICRCDKDNFLVDVEEREQIERRGESVQYIDDSGVAHALSGEETVSMNMWGFSPSILVQLQGMFERFVQKADRPDAEFQLPAAVNELIDTSVATVRILATSDRWCGITYADDRLRVRSHVRALVDRGIYASPLWSGS